MASKNISIVFLSIVSLILVGFAGSLPNKSKNLKVFPKDISDEKLDSIMQTFNKALGVCCEYCHTKDKKDSTAINYADDNPVKEEARKMLKMTMDINKKYFNTDPKIHPAYLNTVKCYTCHKGDAYPQ